MRLLGFGALLVWALAGEAKGQPRDATTGVPPGARPRPAAFAPHATFTKYCVECHGADRPKAGLDIGRLIERTSEAAVGERGDTWVGIARMLETRQMPPDDADRFPSDAERASVGDWIRASLDAYDAAYGGDPGRVTVRRLTSAEYAYVIRDLTGVDVEVGVDASSDAVGGEGFANFGDVQFVQDATVERYLEAARRVADHAVVGSGPLTFYTDPGKTGFELSALNRIQQLYASRGFRVVSGEGGRPFGFDRYAKAFYVAWHYRHRAALGDSAATLRGLAAREGITARFAAHIWDAVNRTGAGFPSRLTLERWQALPAPTSDVQASVARARRECDAIVQALVAWPSWLFARGDLAAGGAGDESPLVFGDTTLAAARTHTYTYGLNRRFGRGGPRLEPGPWTVHLAVDALQRGSAGSPAVIWRNPRVVLLTAPPPPLPDEPAAVTLARQPGPIVSTRPLRSVLQAEAAARLAFGTSPDGTTMGPDDFATAQPTSFVIDLPAAGHVAELHADVELGQDRQAVVRVMISDRPDGPARAPEQRVFLGDPKSAGYLRFRAGIAEYLTLLPPNSHGEPNPADKDPVPPPFDNTYNSPEHDAFVTTVKYQRNDDFFTNSIVDGDDRARLDHAWNDLFGSWPYHDAYLGMLLDHYGVTTASRRIEDMTQARVATLPEAARSHVRRLRAHYEAVTSALKRAEPGHVADALKFASRAWRRPLTPAEQENLRGFYGTLRSAHRLDHDAALRALLTRILMSPAFLYRVEAAPRAAEAALDGWELASRMSFFLWSSIPDEELRRAAAAGELRDPGKLAVQVRRMTADPKARRLATEFFGQWLGFYHFDAYRGVDTGRFPEFTDEVKASMYDEAVSTFEYIVRQGRPVREILHADYAFMNKTLATFYGVDAGVASTDELVRVEGASAFERGGALRLGSVLTTTSAPLRTSPVKRGDWILRRILGTPTPPPLADAGTLPADDQAFGGLTLREKLAQHKRDARCAACHLRIDPLGFPLEGFDAVGRRRQAYADGRPIDVTGEFKDGTTLVGSAGLLRYLQDQNAKVATTLSRKILGYALGRNPQPSDRRLIREMAEAGGDASFSELATRVVTSRQFRTRARGIDAAHPSEGQSAGGGSP